MWTVDQAIVRASRKVMRANRGILIYPIGSQYVLDMSHEHPGIWLSDGWPFENCEKLSPERIAEAHCLVAGRDA